ncbi:hypothetical protein, partial [Thiolapillus sp.]|uniref:hypothetical protein n=1 Tax=Thiolapillus sp. TaxID=2017437 RepID=UPI003AF90846
MKGLPGMGDCLLPESTIMPRFPSSMRSTTSPRKPPQACRYLVIDFGTSKSPKSTRQRDSHYCPGRPASVPLRHTF